MKIAMKHPKNTTNTIAEEHLSELRHTRKIITKLITFIDDTSSSPLQDNDDNIMQSLQWKLFCGEKETLVSALTKLTGLLTKVIPMEQELTEKQLQKSPQKQVRPLSKEDRAIIQKYLKKYAGKHSN
jgi:hypothetical protein